MPNYKTILDKNGYRVSIKSLGKTKYKEIKKELTIYQNIKYDDKKKKIKLYYEKNGYLHVPKYYGIKELGEPETNNLEKSKAKIKLKFKGEMRDYQKKIIKIILETLKQKKGTVLCLPCGRGKTVIAIKLLAMLGVKTLVVTHKTFLMRQWMKQLKKLTNARVGIIQQKKVDVKKKDVVVGMLQSLSKKDYPKEIFKDFGLVIYDECHRVPAPQSSLALPKTIADFTLGLSATPKRDDGLNQILKWHIGSIGYKEEIQELDNVQINIYKFFSKDPKFKQSFFYWGRNKGRPDFTKTLTMLTESKERNKMLVNLINEIRLLPEKRKILILGERKNHLKFLEKKIRKLIAKDSHEYNALLKVRKRVKKQLIENEKLRKLYDEIGDSDLPRPLNNQNLVKTKKWLDECIKEFGINEKHQQTTGFYNGDMKRYELEESEGKDLIFGTYGMANEGLDIPDLNAVVFATPRGKIKQAIGRILRQFQYTINPIAVDIEDQLGIYESQSKKRQEVYSEAKYNMHFYSVKDGKFTYDETIKGKGKKNKKSKTWEQRASNASVFN